MMNHHYRVRFQSEEDTLYAGIEDGTDHIHAIADNGSHDFIDRTSFILREGLCGALGYISLESTLYPGKFWRHNWGVIKLHDRSDEPIEDLFEKDSCFFILNNKCRAEAVSFYSFNFPKSLITKCLWEDGETTKNELRIQPESGETCGSSENVCWVLETVTPGAQASQHQNVNHSELLSFIFPFFGTTWDTLFIGPVSAYNHTGSQVLGDWGPGFELWGPDCRAPNAALPEAGW